MSDRELLEMAAKAAGIRIYSWQENERTDQLWADVDPCEVTWWNPLQSDGDALRLAVKLNLSIVIDSEIGAVQVGRFDFENDIREEDAAKIPPYAATRRAITRAAAEIGKEMP